MSDDVYGWDTVTPTGDDAPLADEPLARPPTLGRYELRDELGRGGVGVVYRAWDPTLGRAVALKVLRRGDLADDASRRRFLREARAAAGLRHPDIVEVLDFGADGPRAWMAMRLVDGPPLSERLRSGPLPVREAVDIAIIAGRALAAAHAQGLIHRDVKPGNLLMEDGRPVLNDFGLVKEIDAEGTRLTRDTQLLGTPAYMAPEQALGGAVTPACDQYALGVVLYEMLSGQRPFPAKIPLDALRRAIEEEPPPIQRPEVPADLARICRRAMAREPGDRFPSMLAFVEQLEAWQRAETIHPSGADLRIWVRGALRRNRRRVAVVLLLLGLAVALPLSGALQSLQAARREARAETRRGEMERRTDTLLRAGDLDAARQGFQAFARFEEHRGTRALSEAWLRWGQRLREREADDEMWTALGTAYALADHADDQRAALTALAEASRALDDWDRLSISLALLRAAAPDALTRPPLDVLAAFDAQTRRDLAVGGPLGVLLSRSVETPWQATSALPWDIDGDGRTELALLRRGDPTVTVVEPTPGLPLRATMELVGRTPHPVSGPGLPPGLAVVGRAPACRLVQWRDDAVHTLHEWPCRVSRGAAAADLDGDGVAEIYLDDDRELLRLTEGPSGWETTLAHRRTWAANSEINALLGGDLDGDGREELVVGTGQWGAYDVRVLASVDGALVMEDRVQLGLVVGLHLARRERGRGRERELAVLVTPPPWSRLNLSIFGPDTPQGAPPGIHRFAFADGRLTPLGHHDLPSGQGRWGKGPWVHRLLVGDLDGDGLDELISGSPDAWPWVLPGDGGAASPLPGLAALRPVDLDGDGDDELLVSVPSDDDAVRVLGAGGDVLSTMPLPDPALPAPPAGLDPALRDTWRRAEVLAVLGMPEVAAERMLDIADLSASASVDALLRAAALLEEAGQREAAGQVRTRAAREDPAQAAQHLEEATRLFLDDGQFALAIEAATRRLALPEPPPGLAAHRDALKGLLKPQTTVDFTHPADPLWRLLRPMGAGWADGLVLESVGAAEVLALPVRAEGAPLRLSVTLALGQMDWGTGWELRFRVPERRSPLALVVLSTGGGGRRGRGVICPGAPFEAQKNFNDETDPLLGEVTITWQYDPQVEVARCTVTRPQGEDFSVRYAMKADLGDGEDLALVLKSNTTIGGVAALRILRVELSGLTPRAVPPSPSEEAWLALSWGAYERALSLLPAEGSVADRLARATALEALGERAGAEALLAEALREDPDLDGLTDDLLLLRADQLGQLLRGLLGDGLLPVLRAAGGPLDAHPEDAPQLEELLVRARTPKSASADDLIWLLAHRGAAWRRRGALDSARSDLEAAVALTEGLPPATDPRAQADRDRLVAETQVELARVHLAGGVLDEAVEAVVRAVDRAPAPEVMADRLAMDPTLDALKTAPGWAPIEAARR
ncbi:MAG: serine/threonine protein kinase [Alphaproteobacteria bacterium]|nr:serine/threonine protein kinase [Alphaproteobacteria bacterium]